jgi:hypothetical protein
MMHVLDRDGLADEAFLARNVLGWEDLKKTVLPKYTPEETQDITGVPADVIVELAHARMRGVGFVAIACHRYPFLTSILHQSGRTDSPMQLTFPSITIPTPTHNPSTAFS